MMKRESDRKDRKCVSRARAERVPNRLTAGNSRAPCFGADQKTRELWERDCGRHNQR